MYVMTHDREPYGVDVPRCEAEGPDLLCIIEALACRVSQSTAIVLVHTRRPRFFFQDIKVKSRDLFG